VAISIAALVLLPIVKGVVAHAERQAETLRTWWAVEEAKNGRR